VSLPSPAQTLYSRQHHNGVLASRIGKLIQYAHVCQRHHDYMQVFASTMQQQVRTQVLTSISRIVYYNTPEMLRCMA